MERSHAAALLLSCPDLMKNSVYILGAGLAVLIIMLIAVPGGGRPSDFSLFLGRFHPLVVHLPIGILLVAALFEALSRWTPMRDRIETATRILLYAGAWSALLAVALGLYLAQGGGYDSRTLAWHKRLGILVALSSSLCYVYKAWPELLQQRVIKTREHAVYATAVGVLILAVAFTGHLGGQLTHGAGYLSRYLPDGLRQLAGLQKKADLGKLQLENPAETTTYAAIIQPVLTTKCTSCHSERRARGGLRLDAPEHIMEGGDEGPPIVPGRAHESELIHRIWLPLVADDHMPPEGSAQLSVAEAELLRWWIDAGASFEEFLPDAEMTPVVQTILSGLGLGEIRTGIFALSVSPPDSQDVAALAQQGIAATLLAEDEPYLQVRCTNPQSCAHSDELEATLRRLAPNIAWLDLGRSTADDAFLETIGALPHLTRLHLQQTQVTDTGLEHLQSLEYLEYLNLYGTAVSDTGLAHLHNLSALRSLYLWQTNVTEAGVADLQAAVPDLYINTGLSLEPVIADSLAE